MNLGKVGLVARFKPLHLGGALMLDYACMNAEHVVIGLGSANRYNLRNPFTVQESEEMVRRYLGDAYENYSIVHVSDFGHVPEYSDGSMWKDHIVETFGYLDHFMTGNDYVRHLLEDVYDVIRTTDIIPQEKWVPIRATQVRLAMAKGQDYRGMVPNAVYEYLESEGLVKRFKDEFGLEALVKNTEELFREDCDTERRNVMMA